MKKRLMMGLVCLLLLAQLASCASAPSEPAATAAPSPTAQATAVPTPEATAQAEADPNTQEGALTIAVDWLQSFLTQDDEVAYAGMDATMQAYLPIEGLSQMREQLAAMGGAYVAVGEATEQTGEAGAFLFVVLLQYEKIDFDATIQIDGEGKASGLFIGPAVTRAGEIPAGFEEINVVIDADARYPLEGILLAPVAGGEPVAAVLLVQGSGPNGMDEIIGANRVFEQLARGFAQRGIATLRYDKRTYGHPQSAADAEFSVEQEYVEDVLYATELLAKAQGIDPERVYLLGHSQGAMLAPRFVDQGAQVKGIILMAGTPRHLTQVLMDQQQALLKTMQAEKGEDAQAQAKAYEAQMAQWKGEYDALMAMEPEEAKASGLSVFGMPAYYLYEMEQYTPALELLAKQGLPTLILQGERDQQVYADVDYALYQKALAGKANVHMKLYEGLNHSFMPSTAQDIMMAMQEYDIPSQIPDEVLDDLAHWVLQGQLPQ